MRGRRQCKKQFRKFRRGAFTALRIEQYVLQGGAYGHDKQNGFAEPELHRTFIRFVAGIAFDLEFHSPFGASTSVLDSPRDSTFVGVHYYKESRHSFLIDTGSLLFQMVK